MKGRLVAAAALALAALAACHSPKTPSAPTGTPSPTLESLREGGEPALQPYLDAFPLGDLGSRIDLLATSDRHSMHLVQARRSIPRHSRATRTETLYILSGTGTCYLGDKSFPITPGATFKIAPGVVHSQAPAAGATIVAVAYFEPPLPDGADDRVIAP